MIHDQTAAISALLGPSQYSQMAWRWVSSKLGGQQSQGSGHNGRGHSLSFPPSAWEFICRFVTGWWQLLSVIRLHRFYFKLFASTEKSQQPFWKYYGMAKVSINSGESWLYCVSQGKKQQSQGWNLDLGHISFGEWQHIPLVWRWNLCLSLWNIYLSKLSMFGIIFIPMVSRLSWPRVKY